jgi:hypothetical protein
LIIHSDNAIVIFTSCKAVPLSVAAAMGVPPRASPPGTRIVGPKEGPPPLKGELTLVSWMVLFGFWEYRRVSPFVPWTAATFPTGDKGTMFGAAIPFFDVGAASVARASAALQRNGRMI